jgi:hypothetical protein
LERSAGGDGRATMPIEEDPAPTRVVRAGAS